MLLFGKSMTSCNFLERSKKSKKRILISFLKLGIKLAQFTGIQIF